MLARILSVSLERRLVNRHRLSAVQQFAPHLHALTVDYLAWLAATTATSDNNRRYQEHRATFLKQLEHVLDRATNPGRIASNIAVLLVAWETFGRFLTERGHWPAQRIDDWLGVCLRELVELARAQLTLTAQERYSAIFLETLRALVASGRAVVLENGMTAGEPGQIVVGVRDEAGTYLITQAAYDEVSRHLHAAGRGMNCSVRALSQVFHHDGLLQSVEPPSLVIKKRIGGSRPCCWHLPRDILEG